MKDKQTLAGNTTRAHEGLLEMDVIFKVANELLSDEKAHADMAKASNSYGDGEASRRMVESILKYKKVRNERPVDF